MKDEQIIVEMKFGSHLYGLATENSDEDFIGVYLPTFEEVILGTYAETIDFSTGDDKSKNTKDDVDRVFYALPYFIEQVEKGNTNALDMLHAPDSALLKSSAVWRYLRSMREHSHTKNMASFVGYVRTQASKYGRKGDRLAAVEKALSTASAYAKAGNPVTVKLIDGLWASLPEGEHAKKIIIDDPKTGPQNYYELCSRKFQDSLTVEYFVECLEKIKKSYGHRAQQATDGGVDWKAVSHALRAGYQARSIFLNGDYTFPLVETDYLLAVKLGQRDFQNEVAGALDALVTEVEELTKLSNLPESAKESGIWHEILYSVYEGVFEIEVVNPAGDVVKFGE